MEGIDQGPLHHQFPLGCVARTLKLHRPVQVQELVFAFCWLITAFRNDIGSSGCYILIQIASNLSFPLLFIFFIKDFRELSCSKLKGFAFTL